MAEFDVQRVREYVNWDSVAQDMLDDSLGSLTATEAELAATAICAYRKQFVADTLQQEMVRREQMITEVETAMCTHDVIDLWDFAPEKDDWLSSLDDVRQSLTDSGEFVDFKDFLDVRQQVHTTPEYTTNLFLTLVLFMLQDDPKKHREAARELRYNSQNQSAWNEYAPTHRFFSAQ